MNVIPFEPSMAESWDAAVARSHAATFQQSRRFLDYHGERLEDASVAAVRDGAVVAAWPAARSWGDPSIVVSHPGATHGGLVTTDKLYLPGDVRQVMLGAFRVWLDRGFRDLVHRPMPAPFSAKPSGLELYWLQRAGAVPTRMDLWNVTTLPVGKLKSRVKRKLSTARKAEVTLAQLTDAEAPTFHALLTDCLRERHGVAPVHSLAELMDLRSRLGPDRQHLWGAWREGELLAASWVWHYGGHSRHAQYIVSSDAGRQLGAATSMLHGAMLEAQGAGCGLFSFGASTADGGTSVNEGLFRFKAGFGLGSFAHIHWRVDLDLGISALAEAECE